jgi:hypothetical protein
MKFVLDESAEVKLALFLESAGHDVEYVRRDFPIGLSDRAILARAHTAHRHLQHVLPEGGGHPDPGG